MSEQRHNNFIVFQILKLLQSRKNALSIDEIKFMLKISDSEIKRTLPLIAKNARIEAEGNLYKYKPLVKFTSSIDVLNFLKEHKTVGIKEEDIKNDICLEELKALIGQNLFVFSSKNNFSILFFNDFSLEIEVDNDIKDLWHSTIVPDRK